MRFFSNDQRGYTHGGIDVVTGVNLFFKFMLLSPIFLFAIYVSITMMKHVIFHGIPSMNKPTEAQQERLREKDSQIGMPVDKPVEAPMQQLVVPQESQPEPQTPVAIAPISPPPVMATFTVPTSRQTQQEYRAQQFKKFCIESWLPRFGNNPNGANSPCMKYKQFAQIPSRRSIKPLSSSRLIDALNSVTR